ncbi:MAG: FAD-dependent oxidoreductase [Deltaproteobacteria bacterium]|jgi:dihydropyrimidine dehydrogenase (NAD+) subunit PreA|nr:FAD-dependent oxidoreductase [Deltaproteobacteria bacterium]MBW2532905.1 FAD-dependent oxidoreductase [Deltaproteobacteria bacterium]
MTELTDAQLRAEIDKCDYCERKPCRDACPAHCSPADFIKAVEVGDPADFQRAAGLIYSHNPLGGICGATCPEFHCMQACSRHTFDRSVEIPDVQETIIRRATRLGRVPRFDDPAEHNGKRVAVIGAGPAGLAGAFALAKLGYRVEIFERERAVGGACLLIPEHRLPRDVLQADLDFLLSSDRIELHLGRGIDDPASLDSFDATMIAVGLTEPIALGVDGEEAAITGWEYLQDPAKHELTGPVLVVGGGAVACDCAVTARRRGASQVEMVSLEKLSEMPLERRERKELLEYGIGVVGRTRVKAIRTADGAIDGVDVMRVRFADGDRAWGGAEGEPVAFDPRAVEDVPGTEQRLAHVRHVIVAIGHRPSIRGTGDMVVAGDCATGPSTVVEASASGKDAAARIHAQLSGTTYEPPPRPKKSKVTVPGYRQVPVPLETDFFGRTIRSPFLLSAAPPTDGYEQMKRAFEAGWAGGIMKTAFDGIPIHIPSEYMFSFGKSTWGNCDNVSGHSLDRVCGEVERLAREFPDRLVMGSTGGPVSGDDEADAKAWQSNTRKLEQAGVGGIEYSLSCPQGGDGTEGDIVSQNAALTAKIIEWILATGDPAVPKLFKLTAAVTSVWTIVDAVREVLARHPDAKAGVTLANTFPALGFRPSGTGRWEEGVIVGLSGKGVTPISNMTLAKVASLGVPVSGNGGPMDYKAAADFLALGAKTVQFCTIAMKYGYGIIDDLHQGLSHLMHARGISSVADLIGIALPEPVTDFMDLSPQKKISACDTSLCVSCGNCARCSYFAIELDEHHHPVTNPERCVGCSICAKKCISGALRMRDRTQEEIEALRED